MKVLGGQAVTVTPTAATSTLPAQVDYSALVPVLQQLTQTLSSLIPMLQAQLAAQSANTATGGAQAGAATVGGGPTSGIAGASSGDGCCGGAMGAAGGAATLGSQSTAGGDTGGAAGAPVPQVADTNQDYQKAADATAADDKKVAAAAAAAAARPSSKGQAAVDYAKTFLGKPYVYGAAGPSSFDCSGLTQYVMKKFGVDLPHNAAAQQKMGTPVDKNNLRPGDLVFFGNPAHHVAIYAGDGKIIEAPKTGENVKISDFTSSYNQKEFSSARRFL